ncbi:hypothetical protein ACIBW9_17225 [Streptomyces sp. NPDC049541]|uniref:hypothetical protein n=1 Tax=Streptomyces sp. NPDC049541 TaxID=3365594 RepID=UPI003799D495
MTSGRHHHGEHESVIYVLTGALRMEFGPDPLRHPPRRRVVVLLPVTVAFHLFQRHFVAGIATTGVK